MLDTSPVVSIWLEMSINWHTKSQGPKKKLIYSSRGRINPWPAHTARNKGSFTPYALWSVESFFSPTVFQTVVPKSENFRDNFQLNIPFLSFKGSYTGNVIISGKPWSILVWNVLSLIPKLN